MKKLYILLVLLLVICAIIYAGSSTTTFTRTGFKHYAGAINSLDISVVPISGDANTTSSTATSTVIYSGTLERVVIAADGNDTAFTVTLKDDSGATLFTKTDCNTVLLPLTYALVTADTGGNNHAGIAFDSTLTVETASVDDVNLLSVNVTIYYRDDNLY